MYRRATALAVLALAGSPGVAAASTELNVIPHGQTQPGVSWAAQPGMLPADAQARMYDRLTPFGADITDAMLAPTTDGGGFFKSAALKPVDDPSFITDDTIGATVGGRTLNARIRRDAYGVPNIYSATPKNPNTELPVCCCRPIIPVCIPVCDTTQACRL